MGRSGSRSIPSQGGSTGTNETDDSLASANLGRRRRCETRYHRGDTGSSRLPSPFENSQLPAAPPAVSGSSKPGSTLTCTPGTWAPDLLESYLYRAPQSTALQWLKDGQPVAGRHRGHPESLEGRQLRLPEHRHQPRRLDRSERCRDLGLQGRQDHAQQEEGDRHDHRSKSPAPARRRSPARRSQRRRRSGPRPPRARSNCWSRPRARRRRRSPRRARSRSRPPSASRHLQAARQARR